MEILFPMSVYSAASRNFTSISVPIGINYVMLFVDVSNICERTPENIAKSITFDLDLSLTGNNPYDIHLFTGMAIKGGVRPTNGTPPFISSIGIAIPSPELSTRKVKGRIVINQSMQIAAMIETYKVN